MKQNPKVIKFPKRGRFAKPCQTDMTPEQREEGRKAIARLRKLLEEDPS